MSLLYANGLLLVLVCLELLFLHYYRKETIAWREIVFNLNSGHILMWILRGMEIAAFQLVLTYFSFDLLKNWNYWAVWMFAFFSTISY